MKEKNKKYQAKPKEDLSTKSAEDDLIRLNKFIANAGVCSRREADKLIANGEILVNGDVVTEMGYKVTPEDEIKHGKKVLKRQRFSYVLLNKPKDYICTEADSSERKTVMDLVEDATKKRLYPVGRLERKTTGLLLFTNDGILTKKATHPSFKWKQKYILEFDKKVDEDILEELRLEQNLESGKFQLVSAEYGDDGHNQRQLVLIYNLGSNANLRELLEKYKLDPKKMDRVELGFFKKGSLTRGKWRYLSKKEVAYLKMKKIGD